jgi:membrane-associated phospholipid phosphatase
MHIATREKTIWVYSTAWGLAIAIAALIDIPIAKWVRDSGMGKAVKYGHYIKVLKWPGTFYFVLPVAIVLGALHVWKWRATVLVLLSGAVSGLFYMAVKWTVGRMRPFKPAAHPVGAFTFSPFPGGLSGFGKAENLSFPSGHVCFAFASAAALARLFPRQRIVFYAFAIVVAGERVAENAHYPSDVVAAAVLGILSAGLTWKAFGFLIPRHEVVGAADDMVRSADPTSDASNE